VILNGVDNHLLRADLGGGIREDGTGHGYQLEALLSYKITPFSSVGLGGRYWHMESNGNTHFEVVGGAAATGQLEERHFRGLSPGQHPVRRLSRRRSRSFA